MQTREQFLAVRKSGIFATDISALTGHNPYRGKWDVFAEKRGELQRKPPGFAAELGILLEDDVLELYVRRTGASLTYPGSIKHPTLPVGATPDAIADGHTVVEAKTRNPWQMSEFGDDGTDHVPPHYFLQTQLQMFVTGLTQAHMPVLFGFNECRIYVIRFDSDLTAKLIDIACTFWTNHIETGIPPAVDESAACEDWLVKKYPKPVRSILRADNESIQLAAQIRELESQSKQSYAKLDKARNLMRAAIGDAHGIEGPGFKASWKADKNGQRSLRFTWE